MQTFLRKNILRLGFLNRRDFGCTNKPKVVIIGSGIGGLVSGALLAKRGYPVSVLEKHHKVGGYATTFERGNGLFNFEISLHFTSYYKTQLESIMKELNLHDQLELAETEFFQFYNLTNQERISTPKKDLEGYIRNIIQYYPDSETQIRAFYDECKKIYKDVFDIVHSGNEISLFKKCIFPLKYPHLFKYRNTTMKEFVERFISNKSVQNIISSKYVYLGTPMSLMPVSFYVLAEMDVYNLGYYYFKNRSQDFSNLLRKSIEDNGGEILLNHAANEVKISNNHVKSVIDKKGREFDANAVICNTSPYLLFNQFLPKNSLSKKYLDTFKKFNPGLSLCIVWLGLNQDIRPYIKGCHGVVLHKDFDTETDFQSIISKPLGEDSMLSITFYDTLFENFSKPGTSSITIVSATHYKHFEKYKEDYYKGNKAEYKKEKDRITNLLIQKAEEFIPGLSSMITVKEAATPLTLERFTGNTHGTFYGTQININGPERLNNKTPIKGLYLASGWSQPLHGYLGAAMSGRRAADYLQRDFK